MIDILTLTADQLEAESLQDLVPEFSVLKGTVENSPWHVQQSVFDHVIKVYRSLLANLKSLDFVTEDKRAGLRQWLSQPVGNLTRHQVLLWTTVLHDISKPETLIVTDKGIAYCPGHELKGSVKAQGILIRIKDQVGLSDVDIQEIVEIIKYHGEPHKLIDSSKPVEDSLKAFVDYQANRPQVYTYLVFLAMADTQGSTLDQADPKELEFRVGVYTHLLNQFSLI